ncbi:hypothetical protein CDD80_3928 [Ophiocordyceps camponoti-rufipedis]|uniref:Rad4 beta-hairpin domain-containing protein n=1 Tax=Ophiocordyceps camponoti-rufipedis TaxID=2004952 RepID=A0A2C5Y590_9HYPO|nr:hypothetical protein CDD80_3928 [Ophiocordyceps camponoti-rufipedis]
MRNISATWHSSAPDFAMVGQKRAAATRGRRRAGVSADDEEPDVYRQMLDEAGVTAQGPAEETERPLKRRRPGSRQLNRSPLRKGEESRPLATDTEVEDDDDDEGVEFQDVILPEPTVQTMERESDDEEDDDMAFENEFAKLSNDAQPPEAKDLELNLTVPTTPTKGPAERRRPMTKEEKARRIDIHRTHLLCLLSHLSRRNHWCNDAKVHQTLRPLLSDKTIRYLTPGAHLPQFGQAESLKTGLQQAADIWKTKFEIRERGLRRSLWADDPGQLDGYDPPGDMESCLDRADFRDAARKLQGSRDVGAQLYCALLRSVGVRARLVCSLQPLACVSGAPSMAKPKEKLRTPSKDKSQEALAKYEAMASRITASSPSGATARRRLGHPNAAAHDYKPVGRPSPSVGPAFEAPIKIRESHHPVYWVEVLDTGHQKWQPADPLVTDSFWKPRLLEPPSTDKENCLCYVVAMEADGTAKDVTRRYAKAYTAKTRKLRIESTLDDGEKWWSRVMKLYKQRRTTDLDQIEDGELAGVEAREPMPRNVQDFKDHPVFALQRHLRRNEVLVPEAKPSGTVSAGSRGPLEKIYRRRDVRVARSVDKWFRLGRLVKANEIPAKWLPKKARPRRSLAGDGEPEATDEDDPGTPIYRMDQTELYEPPAVCDGRVPKNKFGNIEVYVPSMIPKGAVHVVGQDVTRAALIAGIDYAPALTGFQFQGRHGTAVLSGVVVAAEFEEALRVLMEGLAQQEQERISEERRLGLLAGWRRLLMGLRIRERIWSGVDSDERREAEKQAELEAGLGSSETTEEMDMEMDDEGGGFLVE